MRQTLGGLRPSGVGGACAYAAIASGTYLQDVIGSLSRPVPVIIVYIKLLCMSIDIITKLYIKYMCILYIAFLCISKYNIDGGNGSLINLFLPLQKGEKHASKV